jgi:hypothetical protein
MSLEQQRQTVSEALVVLGLPAEAHEWLLDMWEAFQGLDDWRDGDEISKQDIEHIIYVVLAKLPSNPFFQAYANRLLPVVSNVVLRWCGANYHEDHKNQAQLPKCYMWRAGYYDIVLEVVNCVYGHKAAAQAASLIMALYGEELNEYKKEFENA